ncbi:tyrosine-protein phosphatase non-receptor type 13 [Engraulis encrasicolus]|uniref:tyrosine-protein phosphatase non-receptor type 13 n=1 Tax=Engraulis encrasicolus TaxID=184585 RepID=UPI002FD61EE5
MGTLVTLAEVLEERGAALDEKEVWSILMAAAHSLQDLNSTGSGGVCSVITPGSLLLSSNGTVAFKSCDRFGGVASFTAPEALQTRNPSSRAEKMSVYSLGMTLYWTVDYQLPSNQPVQLSERLNSVLLSMCEEAESQRPELQELMESYEQQKRHTPLPPHTRVIQHLVADTHHDQGWRCRTAGAEVRFAKHSRRLGAHTGISCLGHRHRDSMAYGSPGLHRDSMAYGHRDSMAFGSPGHHRDSMAFGSPGHHRDSMAFGSPGHHRDSMAFGPPGHRDSTASWLNRSPLVDGIRTPRDSFGSSCSLTQRTLKNAGPEFVRMQDEPLVILELPESLTANKKRSGAGQRDLRVLMPSGQNVLVKCDVKSKTGQVLDMIIAHSNLVEHFYFGLAYSQDDEFFFLEAESKLSKVAPDDWRKSSASSFTLHFRLKFFISDVTMLLHRLTRHQYYLQLRRDLLDDRLNTDVETQLYLASLALQAEYGDYSPEVCGRNYYRSEHYVSRGVLSKMAAPCLKDELLKLHAQNATLLTDDAELEFLRTAQQLSEYGVLFHRVAREKKGMLGDQVLGVCSKGVVVYDVKDSLRNVNTRLLWRDTLSISSSRRKFILEVGVSKKKHTFHTARSHVARYLCDLCSAQHKFHKEMTSRQLSHSAASEESIVQYSTAFRAQNTTANDMSRLCDDIASRLQAKIHQQRGSLSAGNTPVMRRVMATTVERRPEAPVNMSPPRGFCSIQQGGKNYSLVNQDLSLGSQVSVIKDSFSEFGISSTGTAQTVVDLRVYVSFGGEQTAKVGEVVNIFQGSIVYFDANTPTRMLDRETVCVTLKRDPQYGLGIVIVGEDNSTGRLDLGIFIASVVPGGPADRDGRIKPGGRLISLNGVSLEGVTFSEAADIMQTSSSEVTLIVSQTRAPSMPTVGRLLARNYDSQSTLLLEKNRHGNDDDLDELVSVMMTPKSGARLHVPDVRIRNAQDSPSLSGSWSSLRTEEFTVELRKEAGGLGISITAAVNSISQQRGIYIKNLVAGGVAETDGRIQPGDKLLEVDGVRLDGFSNQQAAEQLSKTAEVVTLLLERDSLLLPDHSSSTTLSNHSFPSITMTTPCSARPKDYSFVSDDNIMEVTLRKRLNGLGFSFLVAELDTSLDSGTVVLVKRLFPGQPAEESGLMREGDVILAVNGEPLKGLTYQRVLQLLRGSQSDVQLLLCRPQSGVLPPLSDKIGQLTCS